MRLLVTAWISLLALAQQGYSQQDCTHKASVIISTLNFTAGCPFDDTGGMDPVLEILNPNGSQLFIIHLGNLNQVTGPAQNFVIDFSNSGNPNACPAGNFSTLFCLGPQPIEDSLAVFTVRIYEKDSNFLNPDCGGFNQFFDSNLGEAQFTFDFTQPSGTIDVGSCISFNYDLTVDITGLITESILGPICPEDNIIVDGITFDASNPTGQITMPGTDGCDTLFDINLSFHNIESIVQFGTSTFCPETTVTIGIDNATDYDSFLWEDGETTSSITVSEPGEYRVTALTREGCRTEATYNLDTFTVDPVSIIGEDNICDNAIIELTVPSNSAGVLWQDGSTDPTLFVTTAGTYSVTITDNNGCTAEDNKVVTLSPIPSVSFTGDLEICEGEMTTLSVFESHSAFLWNDQSENSDLVVTEGGLYSVTVTDFNGCTASSNTSVTVFDLPQPILQGVQDFCFGDSTLLSTTTPFDSYEWNENSMNETLLVTESGLYTLVVSDLNGCTNTTESIINEYDEFIPTISGDLSFCQGDSGTLSLDQNYPTILWEDGSDEQTRDVMIAGTFSATVTDINGCIAMAEAEVSVLDQLQPQLTGGNTLCQGSDLVLGLSMAFTSQLWSDGSTQEELVINEAGTYAVTVTDVQGCTGTADIVVTETATIETQIQTMTCDSTELGQFMFTSISAQGCDSLTTLTVAFDPNCIPMATANTEPVSCQEALDGQIILDITQGNFPLTVTIFLDNNPLQSINVDNPAAIEFQDLAEGDYEIRFESNDNLISESITVTVGIIELLPQLADQVVILEGSSTTLQADILSNAATTFGWWLDSESLCLDNCLDLEVSPLVTTTYLFLAENEAGCIWQDSTVVIVNAIPPPPTPEPASDIYRPNIFSPSATGDDSTFKVFSGDTTFSYAIEIYDRYGNLVFIGDQSAGWDGNYLGQQAEVGIYVYKLTIPDSENAVTEVSSGSFLLIR